MEDIENAIFMFEEGPVRIGDMDRAQLLSVIKELIDTQKRSHENFTKLAQLAALRRR